MRQERKQSADYTVALIGNPNVGKSTLFNRLTGLKQHTGNWPGKTVEQAEGDYHFKGRQYRLVDLPGTYSLFSQDGEESVTADYLRQHPPDCVLVLCDGTCLERNLILVLQLLSLTRRLVVGVNLLDEVKRKEIQLDLPCLQRLLGAPVSGISAGTGSGVDRLLEQVRQTCEGYLEAAGGPAELPSGHGARTARRYARLASQIDAQVEPSREPSAKERAEERLDRLLTRRSTGIPLLLLALLGILWLTIAGANYPSAALQALFDWLEGLLRQLAGGLPLFWQGLLIDGMYGTVARVTAVMLPPMAIFFPLFTLLEDAGFLPRAAFLLDRPLHRCGAEGKMWLTMCMGLGCNAAGVTGCRIIHSDREREIAMVTNALIPCNGRFPALILLAGILLAQLGLQNSLTSALALLALLSLSVLVTMGVSFLLSRTLLRGEQSTFLLELPPYRMPRIGQVLLRSVLDRTLHVLFRAVCVAAPAGIVIWLLANCALPDGQSLIVAAAQALEPVGLFFGLNGVLLLAFVLGLPANELVLPVALLILAGGSGGLQEPASGMAQSFLNAGWGWQTIACCLLFFLFHWPCGTTIATIWKESRRVRTVAAAVLVPTLAGALLCLAARILFTFF